MFEFDVFISFRGEDIRNNFVSYLFDAFNDAGIIAFKDDKRLKEGGQVWPEIVRAIRSSRISVVVLSDNYADSRWCLDELAEITSTRKTIGQLVLPIFYHVGIFSGWLKHGYIGKALRKHEKTFGMEKIEGWTQSLIEATNLMGLTANGTSDDDEAVLVKKIVRWVETELKDQKYLPPTRSSVTQIFKPSNFNISKAFSPLQAPTSELWKYDVFLSYRGRDTRGKFTSHLYHALTDAGVNTFMDGERILLGQEISLGLLQAARTSRISVVVISKGFANSKYCLMALAEIMEWRETMGQLVLPVFYHVDPSDVRHQTGSFGSAFYEHEQRFDFEEVARWRAAFRRAGTLAGWVIEKSSNRGEATIVKEIVRRVSIALNDQKYLHVATFPVGLGSRLRPIGKLLQAAGFEGVRFLGILGMGGIGKSTVAKAIYNQFNHLFEGKSFLADVRANSERHRDVIRLQQKLLDDILKLKDSASINNVDDGISILKERLRGKKSLVILDDVSDLDQMRKLAGEREWFGPGSRIIITTRHLELLKAVDVDSIYEVQALNDEESLQLFCSQAFQENCPEEEFFQLSKEVVSYTKGVPLALEVLGASLRKKSLEEWIGTLGKLKTIPDWRIQAQLKISFDALGDDDTAKELFLDIACFFVCWDKDYVIRIMDSCGLFARKGINVLINRCLVELDAKNKLKMHDLLRDMGREIIRREYTKKPQNRSRLWLYEDILSIQRSHFVAEDVTGIALDLSESDQLKLSVEAFATMKSLRLLKLNNVHIDGEYGNISKELRWLCWQKFSLEFIPNEFYMDQVVAIDMQYSNLREVWKNNKRLNNLKVLNLSHSPFLVRTPDFSNLPNLEELILKDCLELVNIHPSIGKLKRLVLVNLKGCKKLKSFPDSFGKLKSLRTIKISGCSEIGRLPENLDEMESLTKIVANGISIPEVPLCIKCLKNLTYFSLCGCKRSNSYSISSIVSRGQVPQRDNTLMTSLSRLSSLKVLKLMDCDLLGDEIPAAISGLQSLEDLDLRRNSFHSLPDIICQLTKLKTLQLDDCKSLESIPDLPPSLFSLSAVNFESLRRVSFSQFGSRTQLFLTNCHQLTEISGLDGQVLDGTIHLERCSNLTAEFQEFLLKDWCGDAFLPGGNIPDWFHYQAAGSSLSFDVTPFQGSRSKGFTICVIYVSTTENPEMRPSPIVRIEPLGISWSAVTYENIVVTPDDHIWVFHLPDFMVDYWLHCMGEVTLSADFGVGWDVKATGIHCRKEKILFDVSISSDLPEARPNSKRHIDNVESGSRKRERIVKAERKYVEHDAIRSKVSENFDQDTPVSSTLSSSTDTDQLHLSPTGWVLQKCKTIGQEIQWACDHTSDCMKASEPMVPSCDGKTVSVDQRGVWWDIKSHANYAEWASGACPKDDNNAINPETELAGSGGMTRCCYEIHGETLEGLERVVK